MKLFQLALLLLVASGIKAQSLHANDRLTLTFDSLIAGNVQAHEPGGVVMVARKGEIIYRKAFGMANLELDVQANDSMIFYIGSNTKQFTAVAILQMLERGKLQLEDTLGKYIAHAPYPVSSITIQQMLSHSSGIVSNNEADVKKLLTESKPGKNHSDAICPGNNMGI